MADRFCQNNSTYFYIQSFSLTECIVIVGVRKYLSCLSVCLSICASVYLSVCLSVCLPVCWRHNAKTTEPISMKLSRNDLLYV